METEPTRLCRDCGRLDAGQDAAGGCPACGSRRILAHPELAALTIAHIDCDAYYASIEKRDRPELEDLPVIVGGRERGVVTTACYIARRYGVRSAMPTAHALKLCPQAVVLKPDMEKYQRESRRIRALMLETTPVVEPVSIDEAYLDLGPAAARDEPPARALARLALKIEKRIGITVSIGLAPNKMLAKIASDFGKPRGFRLIGSADAQAVIGPLALTALPGVGPVTAAKLEALGLGRIADLWVADEAQLIRRFGLWGRRLMALARAEDNRTVSGQRGRSVTIGAETTFGSDLSRFAEIDAILAGLSETVAKRLARSALAATGLTLKLRHADRRTITRACRLEHATARAGLIWQAARAVLATEADGRPFRLVGITATRLVSDGLADPPDLFDLPIKDAPIFQDIG